MKFANAMTILAVLLISAAGLYGATMEVSQPVQVTSDAYYERGQAMVYDGADYWLFYGRSASITGNYQNSNPDTHDYQVYFKKAASVDALPSATAAPVSGASNSYLGECGAAVFNGEVWTFATIDTNLSVSNPADVYGWYTTDGLSWTQVSSMVTGLSDGAAHHDEVAFNGELFVLVRRSTSFFTTHTATPKSGGWSAEVQVNTGTEAGGGLAHFFVDGGNLYMAILRSPAPRMNYIYQYDTGTDSWSKVAEVASDGWDPTLFKVGSEYVFAQAPWTSDGGGRQYTIGWSSSNLDASFFGGGSNMITEGRYGSNTWIDMWPIGFTDAGGTTYLFYTSERDAPSLEGTGNIWYLKVNWDVTRDHYTYLNEALGAAADGDSMLVAAGTYYETMNITVPNLTMVGADRTSVIIDPSGLQSNNSGVYVAADNVTLESFTLQGGAPGSLPRYGVKFGAVVGGTLEDVEITNCYRSGLDMLGTDGVDVTNVFSHDNGGNGLQGADVRNITYTDITTSNNAWGGLGLFTWGQYTPLGVSNVVITGSNSFGEISGGLSPLYLEEGNYSDPLNPEPITYSSNIADGADVTFQLSDFTYTLHGNSDNDNNYVRFYPTLTAAQNAAAGGVSHILDGRYIMELDGQNLYVPGNLGSVQAAVDASSAADIVNIDPGTFVEQVVVDHDLSLVGSGVDVTVLQSPVTLTAFFNTGSNDNYPVVFANGATDVSLSNLTVDGANQGDSNYRFVGVGFWNAGGSLQDLKVINVMNSTFSGAQHGVGIYALNNTGGPYSLTINMVQVEAFQKNAFALLGDGLTVDLDDVTVVGEGLTSVTAQNGIQIGYGAGGTVDNCTISDVAYDGTSWTATGFLLQDGATVTANGVDISGCQTGVYWINTDGSFNGGSITSPYGDGFYAYNSTATAPAPSQRLAQPVTVPEYRQAASASSDVKTVAITNSSIIGAGTQYSWGIGAFSTSGDPVNLSVTGCTVSNWDYGVYAYDYGGPVNINASGNDLSGNTFAFGSNTTNTQYAEGNWFGVTDPVDVAAEIEGLVDYSPWWGGNFLGDPHLTPWTWYAAPIPGSTIQGAIDAALAGDSIFVTAGTYNEGITIDKALAVTGDGAGSTILDGTGASSTAVHITASDVSFSGFEVAGYSGDGIIVGYEPGGPGDLQNVHIINNSIHDMAGSTAHGFGIYCGYQSEAVDPASSLYEPSVTDWLDYAGLVISNNEIYNTGNAAVVMQLVKAGTGMLTLMDNEIYNAGASGLWIDAARDITVSGNNIHNNSTGIFMSSYGDSQNYSIWGVPDLPWSPQNLVFTANQIENNTDGLTIWHGWPSLMTVSSNVIAGNGAGFTNNLSSGVVTAENNFWGSYDGPQDNAGTDEAVIGTCYPTADIKNTVAEVHGVLGNSVSGGIDYCPWTDGGIRFSENEITYLCDPGTFTVTVSISETVTDFLGADLVLTWPAELVLTNLTMGSAGTFQQFNQLVDNASGTDEWTINLSLLSGTIDGPADLFTLEFSGATSYCTGTPIAMTAADLRDGNNSPIPTPLPADVILSADCDDPVLTVNTSDGGYFNSEVTVNLEASDNCDLGAVYYQIDACDAGGWQVIADNLSGATYGPTDWTMDFAVWDALTEGAHCVYFRVTDDFGRDNADACTSTWCFTKDVSAPGNPTNFFADPGHNKVKLSWVNPADPDVVGIKIQRVAWDEYPLYPSGSEPAYPADETVGTTVFDGSASSYVDQLDLSNATRAVYYYAAFAYDQAGNYSVAHIDAQDRSTSYWLGDVTDNVLTPFNYDGEVWFGDLNYLSATYWLTSTDGGFNAELDFGPTDDNSARGIPEPDGLVAFEDLIIFSINYDSVDASMKAAPVFTDQSADGPLGVVLAADERSDQSAFRVDLVNNIGNVKGMHLELEVSGGATLETAEISSALENSAIPVFAKVRQVDRTIEIDIAIVGSDVAITGSGELVALHFSDPSTSLTLSQVDMRDVDNRTLKAELFTGSSLVVPDRYALHQNYPNPFNPSTEIAFELPRPGHVRLEVLNVLGQVVSVLVDETMAAGSHSVTWHAAGASGAASGVYFYRLTTDGFTATRKMVLLK